MFHKKKFRNKSQSSRKRLLRQRLKWWLYWARRTARECHIRKLGILPSLSWILMRARCKMLSNLRLRGSRTGVLILEHLSWQAPLHLRLILRLATPILGMVKRRWAWERMTNLSCLWTVEEPVKTLFTQVITLGHTAREIQANIVDLEMPNPWQTKRHEPSSSKTTSCKGRETRIRYYKTQNRMMQATWMKQIQISATKVLSINPSVINKIWSSWAWASIRL